MMRKVIRRKSLRLGAATVEVAFTLPILFLLIFAGWEFAYMNALQNTLENATYEAARESMLPGATLAKVEARANEVLTAMPVNNVQISMTPSVITAATDEVTIVLSAPVADNSAGLSKFFTSGSLSSSMTFQRELQPGNF